MTSFMKLLHFKGEKKHESKSKNTIINQLFYGFKNTMLGSITGDDWAIKCYQHIPEVPDDTDDDIQHVEVISRQVYIFHNSKLVRLDIVLHYIQISYMLQSVLVQ